MSRVDLFVDANILIDLAEGRNQMDQYVDGNNLFLSVITEIELLGWHKITAKQESFLKSLHSDCPIVGLSKPAKELAIEIRQKHKIKLPDSIIAASSLHLDVPLLTQGKGFEKIKSLNLFIIQ